MRIILNGWFWGQTATGSGQYLSHLLAHLPEVTPEHEYLLTLWCGHASPGRLHGCRVLPLATPFDRVSENLSKVWFEQVTFPRACRRLEADLAHVPHWGSPLRPTVPTVVTIHDVIPLLLPPYRGTLLVRLYTRLVAAAARRAAGVITVSHASQRDISTHLGLPAERVWVTYEAAPASMRSVNPAQVEAVRRKYSLPERFLLYLGGFDVRKNVAGLLAAFAKVLEGIPSTASVPCWAPDQQPPGAGQRSGNRLEQECCPALVIAGRLPQRDGDFTPDPRRIARELGIESCVHFTGWVDEADKPALYAAAVTLVFPSHYEGFGLPVLEALACGVPVITSDVSSLPEIVGQAGLLVSPDDEAELAAAMEQIWHDVALRERLRGEALAQAARFSWQQTAQATAEVYAAVHAKG